jgi:small subunit ribosomal protein S17
MTKKNRNEKNRERKSSCAKVCRVDCPFHGRLKTRGKIFFGTVITKFSKRVSIEFERMIKIRKYERYAKFKTKIHARLPKCLENSIKIGDYIKIQECRPLSKIIHFVVLEKINDGVKKE